MRVKGIREYVCKMRDYLVYCTHVYFMHDIATQHFKSNSLTDLTLESQALKTGV
jgi:hypothetical protein